MKIAAGLIVAAFGVDIDRTVPPRHPKNRLARLEKFCVTLTKAPMFKEGKFDRMTQKCEGWSNSRMSAFNKCGFYDANVQHGGPDPEVEYKPTSTNHWGEAKQKVDLTARKRRDADCDWDGDESKLNYFMYHDVVEKERVRVQNDNPCAPDYINSEWLGKAYLEYIQAEELESCMQECEVDDEEACEANCTNFLSSRSGGNSRLEAITRRGPFKSARSVVTGMRKWGERYLAECPGRRSGAHMKRRHNFMKTCVRKFVDGLCDHEQCRDDYGLTFKWGGKNLKLENPYLN